MEMEHLKNKILQVFGRNFLLFSLVLLTFTCNNSSKNTMKGQKKYNGIVFWALDKSELEKSLSVWRNYRHNKDTLLVITQTLINAIENIDLSNIKNSQYLKYEQLFINGENYESVIGYVEERKSFYRKIEKDIILEIEIPGYFIREIITSYQFYKSASIFQEVWFMLPYIAFSKNFMEDHLPNSNEYVRKHNFYLKGDIYFNRFSMETELFGENSEEIEAHITTVTKDYAEGVLKYENNTSKYYKGQEIVFYDLMREIVASKHDVFVLEFD